VLTASSSNVPIASAALAAAIRSAGIRNGADILLRRKHGAIEIDFACL
jgi:hypothetical protein